MLYSQRALIRARASSKKSELKSQYLIAKNLYFQAIKVAKKDHQNTFLEKTDPKLIFKAMQYTSPRLVEKLPPIILLNSLLSQDFIRKYNNLKSTLFPPLPQAIRPNWSRYRSSSQKWPNLSQIELKNAYIRPIKGKTPRPNLII